MLSFFPYKNLILQASLCLSLTIIFTSLNIPVRFLHGIFIYIRADNLPKIKNTGVKVGIPKIEGSDASFGTRNLNHSSRGNTELRRRTKSKVKSCFDENNAQILRLKLDDALLRTQVYFDDYRCALTYSILALSSFLLERFLDPSNDFRVSIPPVLGFIAILKTLTSLIKLLLNRSASGRRDKQLSISVGILGFLAGLPICLGLCRPVLEFEFESFDEFGRLLLVALMASIASLLYMPSKKCARSFWLGTHQLNKKLSIISCGWITRTVLFSNYIFTAIASFIWIRPLAETIYEWIGESGSIDLLSGSDYARFRLWCLFVSGILQAISVRPNLQIYLNEAVLCWYQGLHGGSVPNMEYIRAKISMHNRYLVVAAVQFLAPSSLMLLFLGFSQVEVIIPCYVLIKQASLFLAWWVAFLWTVFTSVSIVLHGFTNWYVC